MTRNDLLTLAQRLREYNHNPHHINPTSEAFHNLIAESASAISMLATPPADAADMGGQAGQETYPECGSGWIGGPSFYAPDEGGEPCDECNPPAPHPDDAAVDRFAAAMKAKLAKARDKGRGGWDDPAQCSAEFLAKLLIEHLTKGNAGTFEDVANFAMMLHQRGADPQVLAAAASPAQSDVQRLREALDHIIGLSRALRVGGPDPMDLEGLSNALEEAVDTAHAALAASIGQEVEK